MKTTTKYTCIVISDKHMYIYIYILMFLLFVSGVGDHFQSLRCSKAHVPDKSSGGVGPLPGPQVARRDMYGTAYTPTYYSALLLQDGSFSHGIYHGRHVNKSL